MSFTGQSPKDKETLVTSQDKPKHHEHGINPVWMNEPKSVEEAEKPLGYQEHKAPGHPTRYPQHKLGKLPSKPTLEDYKEFMRESPMERTSRKITEAPIIPLGIIGFFATAAYGIWRFKKAPKHVTASSYFVQLRVIAQSVVVGSIAAIALHQLYQNVISDYQSTTSNPVDEAKREGKAFILQTEDTHHKSAITDDRTRDILPSKQ